MLIFIPARIKRFDLTNALFTPFLTPDVRYPLDDEIRLATRDYYVVIDDQQVPMTRRGRDGAGVLECWLENNAEEQIDIELE